MRKMSIVVNESTIREFMKAYDDELSRKIAEGGNRSPVKALVTKRRGRPVILGSKLDLMVQKYVQAIRERGGIIDTAVDMSAAKGIAMSMDRTQLSKSLGEIVAEKNEFHKNHKHENDSERI